MGECSRGRRAGTPGTPRPCWSSPHNSKQGIRDNVRAPATYVETLRTTFDSEKSENALAPGMPRHEARAVIVPLDSSVVGLGEAAGPSGMHRHR